MMTMMFRTRSSALLAPAASLLLASACSTYDDSNEQPAGPDAGSVIMDTGGSATPDTAPGPTEDTGGTEDGTTGAPDTVDTDGGTAPPPESIFTGCTSTAECSGAARCIAGACVIPPTTAAALVESTDTINPDGTVSRTLTQRPETALQFGCYAGNSLYTPGEGPSTATIRGVLERFGSGPSTNNLCVAIYDEPRLLAWLQALECNSFDFANNREKPSFVACFQLDTCRCQEAYESGGAAASDPFVQAANQALTGTGNDLRVNSLDTCLAFVGNCSAIGDAATREICVNRVRTLSGDSRADTLVYGSTRSTRNPESEFALYEVPGVPTNRRLAFKGSGLENRWRDTWEYGMFARADLVQEGSIEIDANIVAASTWQTIPPAVGFPGGIDDANGAVAGAIRDCGVEGSRRPWLVENATAGFAFLTTRTRLAYFNGNPNNRLPNSSQVDTNMDGLFAAVNLPPGPNRVSTMACVANCNTPQAELVAIGARDVFQTPKSVIIATFEGIGSFPR
jgi:hypothetical protein